MSTQCLQAYLVGTDTEYEPFEDHVKTETPESPHTVASPTPLPDSTPPTRHAKDSVDSDTSGARSTPSDSIAPLLPDHPLTHASPTLVLIPRRTAHMVVHVPPVMSPDLSASIAEVAAMSDSAFCKRFRSSYESSPSLSLPDLPSRKHYRGTSKLVEDDEEEDEEIEESSNPDSESEDAEDEGPIAKDEDPAIGDEGLAVEDEGPGMRVDSLSLGGDEAVPKVQQWAAPVVETTMGQGSGSVPDPERPERVSALRQPTLTTWIDLEDGIAYIDVHAYPPPASPVQTSPSLEWSSASPATAEAKGFLTELGARVEMQGGLIHDHTVRLGELSPSLFERYDRDIGELFTRSGAVRDEIFSQRYRFRSLEHE
ncbi:hypothetical protein Tco_0553501 [Tanacetum coccineum]